MNRALVVGAIITTVLIIIFSASEAAPVIITATSVNVHDNHNTLDHLHSLERNEVDDSPVTNLKTFRNQPCMPGHITRGTIKRCKSPKI